MILSSFIIMVLTTSYICIDSEPAGILREKLLSHEFDVIFTVLYDAEISHWNECRVSEIVGCPFAVCMKKDNPLADTEIWDVENLKDMNLIVISSFHVPSYSKILIALCGEYGFRPHIIYNTSNANSQIYNLHCPNDVFICDRFHRDYNSEKMICRELRNTKSGVSMVWRSDVVNTDLNSFISMFHSDHPISL